MKNFVILSVPRKIVEFEMSIKGLLESVQVSLCILFIAKDIDVLLLFMTDTMKKFDCFSVIGIDEVHVRRFLLIKIVIFK